MLNSEQNIQAQYDQAIVEADKLYSNKEYFKAKDSYSKAITINQKKNIQRSNFIN